MRLLVACPSCQRQYDASGYPPGSRFRCHCAAIVHVHVHAPAAHEARVVRCAGCGAPRGEGRSCTGCGAAHIMFERDMASMCPACMTRVSDHARFCHSCGGGLGGAGQVGDQGELVCPACGGDQHMHHRHLGPQLALLECSGCAGLWLERETFEHAITRAQEMVEKLETSVPKRTSALPLTPVRYRSCPTCAGRMARELYGKRSGVVIDFCQEHGVWLDAGELSLILEWIRGGGLDKARALHPGAEVGDLPERKLAKEFVSIDTGNPRGELERIVPSFWEVFFN